MSGTGNSNYGGLGKSETKQASTWLKPEQVEKMRDACYSNEVADYLQERNEVAVQVAYDTALRVQELVALKWEDFDLEEGTLYLRSEVQKGEKPPVTMELAGETVRMLKRYNGRMWRESEYLFPSRQSDQMTDRSMRNVVEQMAVLAGVRPYLAGGGRGEPEDVSPHTLRHSLAYRMVMVEDKRMVDVQLRLRHSSMLTTEQIYSHFQTV